MDLTKRILDIPKNTLGNRPYTVSVEVRATVSGVQQTAASSVKLNVLARPIVVAFRFVFWLIVVIWCRLTYLIIRFSSIQSLCSRHGDLHIFFGFLRVYADVISEQRKQRCALRL